LRAYVSIDFEGLPGIASIAGLSPRGSQYGRSEDIVTRIAKFVVEQLLGQGVERVIVADSHGSMTNIDYRKLPKGASVIQGYPRPLSMVTGINEGYDAVFFIGYHAAAGTTLGFLDHTYSGMTYHRILINDYPASEYLINALVAGKYNVPVALVAGDKALEKDVEKFTPWSVFVPLKKGYSRYSAIYDSIDEVCDRLKEGIKEAVRKVKHNEVKPLKIEIKEVIAELRDTIYADIVSFLPFVERLDAYTLKINLKDPEKILEALEAIALMCYGVHLLRERI